MPVLSVSYDLHEEPGRVYEELFEAIKGFPAWCHAQESLWFISTKKSCEGAFKVLAPHLHAKDKVLVTPVQLDVFCVS